MYGSVDRPHRRNRDVGIPFSAETSLTVAATQACLSIVWIILFGIIAFHVNPNCPDPILEWNVKSFWIFIAIIIIQLSALTLVFVFLINNKEILLQITSIALLVITAALLLYVWIDGVVVISESQPITQCEALYYLDLIYLIIAGIDVFCIIIMPLAYIACCGILTYFGIFSSVV